MDLHHELPASQTGVQNYLHLESMASVIGLAPIRPGLKDRLREWWPCANTFAFTDYWRRANKWSPRLVSRQRLLVFSEALICLSYSGKWLAEPKLGERKLVVPAGKHFRAGTSLPVISRVLVAVCKHLLSYRTER